MSDEQVKGIQRYDMIAVTRCGEGWQELQKEPEGEWMRYEDHLAALAAQQEEIDRLKASIDRLLGSVEYALRVGYKAEDCGDHCSNGCYWCDLRNEVARAKTEATG